jgi:hypothetical protein
MLGRVNAILVLTVGASLLVGCGRAPLMPGDDSGSAGTGGHAGSGTGSAAAGGNNGGATGSAGTGSAGTGAGGGTECAGLDEATCDAAPACTAVQCPDCMGGKFFAACLGPGVRFGCGPCPPPPPCSTLGEMACTARADCHPGYCGCAGEQMFASCLGPNEASTCPAYACPAVPACAGLSESACTAGGFCQANYCNWCQQRTFVGCSDPGTPLGCPTGGPAVCPAVVPCTNVTDQLSCDARTDCHSVFVDNSAVCDCSAPGCCVNFARCADGGKAACKGTTSCHRTAPYCGSPAFVVSYTADCYEGCVRPTECAP